MPSYVRTYAMPSQAKGARSWRSGVKPPLRVADMAWHRATPKRRLRQLPPVDVATVLVCLVHETEERALHRVLRFAVQGQPWRAVAITDPGSLRLLGFLFCGASHRLLPRLSLLMLFWGQATGCCEGCCLSN